MASYDTLTPAGEPIRDRSVMGAKARKFCEDASVYWVDGDSDE